MHGRPEPAAAEPGSAAVPLAGSARLGGPITHVEAFDQIRQPQDRAGIPLPAVSVGRVAAPAVPTGRMTLPKAIEHVRPLREQREFAHERPEDVGGRTSRSGRHRGTTRKGTDGLSCSSQGLGDNVTLLRAGLVATTARRSTGIRATTTLVSVRSGYRDLPVQV